MKKRTRIMSNSPRIAYRLRKAQCTKDREHAQLISFKVKECEVHPDRFCKDVCLGTKDEINDKLMRKSNVDIFILNLINDQLKEDEKSLHDDLAGCAWLYEGKEVYDDITGEYFDNKRAMVAGKLEMDIFRKNEDV